MNKSPHPTAISSIVYSGIFLAVDGLGVSIKNRDAVRVDIHRVSRLVVELDIRALELLSECLCLVVDPLRFVRAGYGSKFSADRHVVTTVQFSYVVSGHKIKKANKSWDATAISRHVGGWLIRAVRPQRR